MNSCIINILLLTFSYYARANYTLSIVHFNDFHARYEPINNVSGTCQGNYCIGGFSRLYAAIMKLIDEQPNPIVLNAGDNFIGSLWYTVFRWNVTQHFINKLPLDAMTLGNHEFDDEIDGLVPYLQRIKTPIVVANIDATNEPKMQGLFQKSIILEKNGRKIGIIGVVTNTTSLFSKSGNLIFLDESESVNKEAERLTKLGVFTNIVLSHCGYEADLYIARKSKGKISVVVGGHTDTFLYTGDKTPGPDRVKGPYPTLIVNNQNESILVVQASAYTKYLGNLSVVYDNNGTILKWSGNPIFLNYNLPTSKDIDDELGNWKQVVDKIGNRIIGSAMFEMMNSPCRANECLLGNFATDAMVFSYVDLKEEDSWSYASVALLHAGGFRAGIDLGDITYSQLLTTFPFSETVDVLEMKGKHLKEILENSMSDMRLKYPHLYQVSGLHIVFNTTKPEGDRIESLEIRCKQCKIPVYEKLEEENVYRIIVLTFLTSTAFEPLFNKYAINKRIGFADEQVFLKYLNKRSPIFTEIEGRIKILN